MCVCACVYWLPAQCVERCCVPGNRMSLCLGFILLVNVSRFSPWGLRMPLCLLLCVCVCAHPMQVCLFVCFRIIPEILAKINMFGPSMCGCL